MKRIVLALFALSLLATPVAAQTACVSNDAVSAAIAKWHAEKGTKVAVTIDGKKVKGFLDAIEYDFPDKAAIKRIVWVMRANDAAIFFMAEQMTCIKLNLDPEKARKLYEMVEGKTA